MQYTQTHTDAHRRTQTHTHLTLPPKAYVLRPAQLAYPHAHSNTHPGMRMLGVVSWQQKVPVLDQVFLPQALYVRVANAAHGVPKHVSHSHKGFEGGPFLCCTQLLPPVVTLVYICSVKIHCHWAHHGWYHERSQICVVNHYRR